MEEIIQFTIALLDQTALPLDCSLIQTNENAVVALKPTKAMSGLVMLLPWHSCCHCCDSGTALFLYQTIAYDPNPGLNVLEQKRSSSVLNETKLTATIPYSFENYLFVRNGIYYCAGHVAVKRWHSVDYGIFS